MNDTTYLTSKMKEVLDFYKRNEGRLTPELKKDIEELEKQLLEVHSSMLVLRSWEGAV